MIHAARTRGSLATCRALDVARLIVGSGADMPQQTVLVVDDDADIRNAITAALEDEGYAVRCALGGTVLRVAQEAPPPDVILLDVMMPHIDGAKLSQLLRANPRTAQIPIVAMTAMPKRNV